MGRKRIRERVTERERVTGRERDRESVRESERDSNENLTRSDLINKSFCSHSAGVRSYEV